MLEYFLVIYIVTTHIVKGYTVETYLPGVG